jgi:AcrR family transcriptional regulator
MSKAGFAGATISRIARKSGVSIGSICNFYPDKETLMNDAVSELLRTQQNQILDAKRTATTAHRQNFGLTDSFQFALVPSRRTWLRFRQECIIATRHHKKTLQQMKRVVVAAQQTMADAFPTIDRSVINLVSTGEQVIGFGFGALFGYSNLLDKCDFDAVMVQVTHQNGL